MSLKDKVVVISGASGGLGRVATQVFAEAGAKLALLGRSVEKLDANAAEFGLDSKRHKSYGLDLSHQESANKVSDEIVDRFGSLDIFINLVGGWIGGKNVLDTDIEDIDGMLHQHVRTSFIMTKAFLPPMLKNSWGRLLAVSSPNAVRPPGKNSPYSIGKAGLDALMHSLAEELKDSGVTANLVQVKTIDLKHERINHPSKRNRFWTTPEEISATMLHLSSEDARMINGARIPLFGSPN